MDGNYPFCLPLHHMLDIESDNENDNISAFSVCLAGSSDLVQGSDRAQELLQN